MYLPIKFTANKAQIPCSAVKSSAVKNLFDLKYAINITIMYMANKTPRRILPEFIFCLLKVKKRFNCQAAVEAVVQITCFPPLQAFPARAWAAPPADAVHAAA